MSTLCFLVCVIWNSSLFIVYFGSILLAAIACHRCLLLSCSIIWDSLFVVYVNSLLLVPIVCYCLCLGV